MKDVDIQLYASGTVLVSVDRNLPLLKEQFLQFIEHDGFESTEDFIEFFFGNKEHGRFIGQIIYWN